MGVFDGDWLLVAILLVGWLVCASLDVDWLLTEDLGVDWPSADLGVDWLDRTNEMVGDGVSFAGLRPDWLVCGVPAADWLRRAANWPPICLGDGLAVGVTAFKGF